MIEFRLEKTQVVTDNLSKAMINMKTSIKTSITGKYLGKLVKIERDMKTMWKEEDHDISCIKDI